MIPSHRRSLIGDIATGQMVDAVEDGKGVPTPGRGRLMEGRDKCVSRLYKLISAVGNPIIEIGLAAGDSALVQPTGPGRYYAPHRDIRYAERLLSATTIFQQPPNPP